MESLQNQILGGKNCDYDYLAYRGYIENDGLPTVAISYILEPLGEMLTTE